MSGHSKWSTIKRKKAAIDAKRGNLFTKLARAITIAARESGGDMEANFALRLAVEKAKRASMPADNIERAINRGTGEGGEGMEMEREVYGGYGPGGVAILVDVFTDNKNRTISELRKIFDDRGGNIAETNSVLWQFTDKGRVLVKCAKIEKAEKFGEEDKEVPIDKDEVMMAIMDIEGVEDIKEDEGESEDFAVCEVLTDPKQLAKVEGKIRELGYLVEEVEIARIPTNMVEVDDSTAEKLQGLFEVLDEHDDVENIWFNTSV